MIAAVRRRTPEVLTWIDEAPERRWRQGVLALAAAGLLARLLIIVVRSSGGGNLRIYWWFAHVAANGHNPYHAPLAGAAVNPNYGDNPPLEMLLFAGVLKLHDSQTSIRVFVALVEMAFVIAMGLRYPRDRRWRAGFCVFMALNPFVLLVWTAYTSDKVLVIGPIAGVLAALAADRVATAWAWTTFLAALKWVGTFFALPLLAHSLRRVGVRSLAAIIAACAAGFAVLSLAWFPSSLEAWHRRDVRIDLHPTHAALTQLLAKVHLYSSSLVRPFIVAAIVLIVVLYLRKVLDIGEAIVLAVFAAYLPLPDEGVDRILMVTLPLLFVLNVSGRRWAILWAVSAVESVAFLIQELGPHAGQKLIGGYASIGHVLLMNPIMLIVFGWLVADRWRGRERPVLREPEPSVPLRSRAVAA
ncbi:MAG: hypothetical protein JWN32_448 [Solirubrobacterales bacterium]|nr:hypothetical protein [Solirubrobacterales bacterium]